MQALFWLTIAIGSATKPCGYLTSRTHSSTTGLGFAATELLLVVAGEDCASLAAGCFRLTAPRPPMRRS
jgi:hypothetical protein